MSRFSLLLRPRAPTLTVALLGADGSGKTSVAKTIIESCPLPVKYLYMGVSIESSNIALPTSRLVHLWKVHRYKRRLRKQGRPIPEAPTLHNMEHRVDNRGKVQAVARLLYRLTEESYRQLVSWIYQLRGYVVIYDRHFLFDVCSPPDAERRRRTTDRIHSWFLRTLYPKPELVILLDAPADVLYARKQEVSQEYLEADRARLFETSAYANKFYCVDANRPFDDVVAEVAKLLIRHAAR